MSDGEDDIDRHAKELVRLTKRVFDSKDLLPEDELAALGQAIAFERQLLIDAIGALLRDEEPDSAACPGVAEFDAGFRFGLEFSRAIDDAKVVMERVRRGRLLRLVR